ncbi:MAG TPA: PEP-utilizing enzyme [Syntrophobacteraceae bacterium]|nr:PEP-utilizing enzyme [Syntrophobacteraceae bacterium]
MENLSISHKPVAPIIPPDILSADTYFVARKLKGVAASSGIVEGPCTIIRNLQDLHTLQDGAILVCETASPELAPFIPFLKGFVAERGGLLSNASGYARQYGIPAVVGATGIMDSVHDGDVIRVDGSTGAVDIIG